MSQVIRIGSRKSALALKQTELIARQLKESFPDIQVEIVTKDTLGDRILDRPLQAFGGKGVFVSEFEEAIAAEAIDLAVHSAKDMPMELADGLTIAAVSKREDPKDVLVLRRGFKPENIKLEEGHFTVGTSSPRRQLQIKKNWKTVWHFLTEKAGKEIPAPELTCKGLRGNVHTRLSKLEAGEFDGIILAAAGLKRLNITEGERYEFYPLEPEMFIPAGGQGILAVEGKQGSLASRMCKKIDCREARLCLEMERKILHFLDAGCHEPIGVYAQIQGDTMKVRGISERQGVVRSICLSAGLSEEEQRRLADEAGKGLKE